MKIQVNILCVALVLLTISCNTSSSPSTLTQTQEVSILTDPINTPTLPVINYPTQSIIQEPKILKHCLEVSTDAALPQVSDTGSIVFQQNKITSVLYQKLDSPYIYKIDSGETLFLPNASSPAVSLDNDQLAFIFNGSTLIIADSDGNTISSYPFEDISVLSWVKDGLIAEVDTLGHQAFINPISGERKILDENFPNQYQPDDKWADYWYPTTLYSPDLTMAVYIGSNETKSETFVSLFNVNTNEQLASVSRGAGLSIAPQTKAEWSNNSEQVIIQTFGGEIGNKERNLISVYKDGTVKTLLSLNNDMATMRYSLSPDQNRIAFWSPDPSSSQVENLRLFILNLESGEVIDYCIVSPALSEKPIWSPDSKNIVVELLMADLENSDVVMILFEKEIAVKIAENAQPVGWLK